MSVDLGKMLDLADRNLARGDAFGAWMWEHSALAEFGARAVYEERARRIVRSL